MINLTNKKNLWSASKSSKWFCCDTWEIGKGQSVTCSEKQFSKAIWNLTYKNIKWYEAKNTRRI